MSNRGIRLIQEELVDRFGISERLAVRVRALLKNGIEVSAAVLETAQRHTPLERLLLRPEILREAKHLTPEQFQQMLGSGFGGGNLPVLLLEDDGSRVILLDEELAVSTTERQEMLPSLLSPVDAVLRLIGKEESERLFGSEEIARLKITILTSANPAEKIEAMRRLVLSPLDNTSKGLVLVHALADDEQRVRVEAAEALTALGLNPGIAWAARLLGEGSPKQRIKAAERMAVLIENVSEAETGVVLTMLAGAIKKESEAEVVEALIRSFKGACGFVAGHKEYAAELVRLLIRELEGTEKLHYRAIRDILGEIGQESPEALTELLSVELSAVSSKPLKRLIFGVLALFPVPEEARGKLAQLAIDAMEGSGSPEEECQGIGSMLSGWGELAVEALMTRIFDADEACKIYMIHLLDEIVCRRGGEARADEAARVFLDLLRVSDKHTALPILESRLICYGMLSERAKSEIAAELLDNLTGFANPRIDSVIENALICLGVCTLPSLKRFITAVEEDARRAIACRVVGVILAEATIADEQRSDFLDFLLELWESGVKNGYIAEVMGRIAGKSSYPAAKIEQIKSGMMEGLNSTREPAGILKGLSGLVEAPALSDQGKTEIVQTYFDLVKSQLPDIKGTISKTKTADDDDVHCFGNEVLAYTDILPACFEGLEDAFFHVDSEVMRSRIAELLIKLWNDANSLTIVLGPDTQALLMRILARVARESDDEHSTLIAKSLLSYIEFPGAIRELGSVFLSKAGSASLGALACKMGKQLLETLKSGGTPENAGFYEILAGIACRVNLGKDPAEAFKFRERAVDILYKGLKGGHPQAIEGLRRVCQSEVFPKAMKDEIEARLNLVRSPSRVDD